MAKTRIRRRVTLNGQQMWITATSEQEYAEAVMAAYAEIMPQQADAGHPFNDWIQQYYLDFIKRVHGKDWKR